MKIVSLLLLVCMPFLMVPLVSGQPQSGEASLPSLMTLDLCDTQTAGIQAASDIPLISEYACGPLPTGSAELHEVSRPALKAFINSFQCERPPEA